MYLSLKGESVLKMSTAWTSKFSGETSPLYHVYSCDCAVDVLIPLKSIVKFLLKVLFVWLMLFL